MTHRVARRHLAGFTLIELMIVVAVVAILSAIAYASYGYAVVKARRSAAAACLQERAQFMERYYTTHLSYVDAPAPAQCEAVPTFYTLAFEGTPTATAFGLTATPLGGQASADTKCAVLHLNQAGERSVSGTAAATDCW